MLDESQSFSLSANVTSPGPQSIVLKGYLVQKRNGETWVAPLIPQLFYGVSGTQLTTWRQWLPTAGEQVILSRASGHPEVPREELYWRKVSEEAPTPSVPRGTVPTEVAIPWGWIGAGLVALGVVGLIWGLRSK